MSRRVSGPAVSAVVSGLLVGIVGCSSPAAPPAGPGPEGSPAPACAPELEDELVVSEGGRRLVKVPAGTALEGLGGVVVTRVDDSTVSVRAPYGATGEPPAVVASCGRQIALSVRKLAWTKLAGWTDETGAPAREYGTSWLDAHGAGGLVVFGGFHYQPTQFTPANDAWRFDFGTSTWSTLAGEGLPTLPGARVAPVPGARAVYAYGGTEEGPTKQELLTKPALYRLDVVGDVVGEAELRATKLDASGVTYGSYTGAFVWDAKRSRWLALCGADSEIGAHCEVASFTEATGLRPLPTAGTAPDGRYGFHYALDEENDRVVVFGGQGTGGDDAILGDTWTLDLATDPPRWSALRTGGVAPKKRRNGAYVLDVRGHRLFVWGGTPDGRASVKGLQALSLDRGSETWTDVPVGGEAPPSRTSGLAVADPERGRILFGFGNDRVLYRDLWALAVE